MIKGIDIEPRKTVKLAQYADDTTVILKDSESILHLFELLSQFEKCAGLRINESKSELLWLGSDRFRKDKIRNLKLNEEPILALGVYFSHHDKLAAQRNFFDKLASLKKILNIWSPRDISIYGRINIVKTLALSKLTLCSGRPHKGHLHCGRPQSGHLHCGRPQSGYLHCRRPHSRHLHCGRPHTGHLH